MDEEILYGGTANAGQVTRRGAHVLRPASEHTRSIFAFLAALSEAGFDGASRPVGIDQDGRERLTFIAGDVAIAPYPAWVQADSVLRSLVELMGRLHTAARAFDPVGHSWSAEMADPRGGPIICHNDVCLENVVFRNGRAVGLIDFDFAAPGRPVYDLAQLARMCVPIDDEVNGARLGWTPADKPARLRLVADAYGLDPAGRAELLAVVDASIEAGGAFLSRKVEAGDANFTAMWNDMGGVERFDRRLRWWHAHRPSFAAALA